jgi:hypothetical protein
VHLIDTVAGDRTACKLDSVLMWEYGKINEDAWLSGSIVVDAHLQFAEFIKPWVPLSHDTRISVCSKFNPRRVRGQEEMGR